MAILLSDPLPLRRTTDHPAYRVDAFMPWVYGRCALEAIPMDKSGLLWLLADHPVQAVASVEVDGVAVSGYELIHQVDGAGVTQALLKMSAAPKADPVVRVAGKRHPATGALITHPVDVALDILSACGIAVPAGAFDALLDDHHGVEVGQVLGENSTVRQVIAALMDSVGATWSARPWMARASWAWPAARAKLTPLELIDPEASATHDGLATTLRISYAHDASGRAGGAVTLRAPARADDIGDITLDMAAPWLRTARDAVAVGERILQDKARPAWTITARVDAAVSADWMPGDVLNIQHPLMPAGDAVLLSIDESTEGVNSITLRRAAGITPLITLVQLSRAVDADRATSTTIYKDGVATFTIVDDAGGIIAGAAVTMDGQDTRTTDRFGVVQFKAARGSHTLTILADGYEPFSMEVTV
ncbi:MAG: phage tail protein [Pseudomonadota bacterium]